MIQPRIGSGIVARQRGNSPTENDFEFDPKEEPIVLLASAIGTLAEAINRLAATQEKPKSKGAVSFSTAHFEDQPDAQTQELRDLSRQRGEGGEE